MKRNDDNSGIIKIPDVSAVTASAANQQQQSLQPPVFITRQPPPHIEMASRPSVTSGNPVSQISLPRVAHTAHGGGVTSSSTGGVTVYRSEPSHPPAAHSGGIAVSSASSSTQQPPAAHSIINQQPPTTINPDQISKLLKYNKKKYVFVKLQHELISRNFQKNNS